MAAELCAFVTDRLDVRPWHTSGDEQWPSLQLDEVVSNLLTAAVTRHLPPAWQGDFSEDRARDWIEERDRESPTLLVLDRATKRALGLIILFESEADDGRIDLRLGYLLSEQAWGQGYGTELLAGLVGWAEARGEPASLSGGVSPDNTASRRVLERCGFSLLPHQDPEADELLYELRLD